MLTWNFTMRNAVAIIQIPYQCQRIKDIEHVGGRPVMRHRHNTRTVWNTIVLLQRITGTEVYKYGHE